MYVLNTHTDITHTRRTTNQHPKKPDPSPLP